MWYRFIQLCEEFLSSFCYKRAWVGDTEKILVAFIHCVDIGSLE